MGALYGYLSFIKKPEPNIPDQMRSASAYWGRDNHFFYSSDHIFIGNNHRFNTPEAVYEEQPYTPIPNNYLFFTGRIDNRKELTLKLDIKDEPNIPDGIFVSKAWEKYKTHITDHIIGDWVVVVWEANERKLHIIRDHHGYSAMYYYSNNEFFAFATSIKSLLALEAIPKKPNMLRVAQVLTSWHGKGIECGYMDILRLPPAHFLLVNDQLKVDKTRFWFPENIKTLNYQNEEDYYSHFLEEYSRAVEVRLRSYKPVGSQLSGGLDSGSVVALAAMHLKKKGISLPAFTSVPAYSVEGLTSKTRFGDESTLAKLTADFTGNTDWYPIDAKDVDPFEAIRKGIEIHDEPFRAGANTFWINEIKRIFQEEGIGTMLIGQGGNGTVSWPTRGLIKRITKKRNLLILKDFYSYYGWRHNVLPMLIPHSVKNLINKKLEGPYPYLKYSAINQDYTIKNRILKQMKEEFHDPYFRISTSTLEVRLKLIKPGRSVVGFLHSQDGAWNNVEIRDPTYDKKLIECCLSVPDIIYVNNSNDRLLIRESFKEMLPQEVLWNKKIGKQAADIGHRIVRFQETGSEIIQEISNSKLCNLILDINRMKQIQVELTKDVNSKNSTEAATVLLRGITIGLFLLRF